MKSYKEVLESYTGGYVKETIGSHNIFETAIGTFYIERLIDDEDTNDNDYFFDNEWYYIDDLTYELSKK